MANARAGAYVLPPPILGWNTRDALGEMKEGFAGILDNYVPSQGSVAGRPGYETSFTGAEGVLLQTHAGDLLVDHVGDYIGMEAEAAAILTEHGEEILVDAVDPLLYEGSPGNVAPARRLFSYITPSFTHLVTVMDGGGLRVLSGAVATAPVEVARDDSAGLMGAEVARFDDKMIMGTGSRAPCYWNGSALTDLTITGPSDATKLKAPLSHRSRMYWIEQGTCSFWYGATNAIQGAFTEFDLSLVRGLRGELVGLAALSKDAGDGPDDFFAAIGSDGDLLVYSGSDPGDAENWALVGHYSIPRPLLTADKAVGGKVACANLGGDLVIATEAGYLSVFQLMSSGVASLDKASLSAVIDPSVQAAVLAWGMAGWRMVHHPSRDWLIVMVPGAPREWHVRKLAEKAWWRLVGWDSLTVCDHAQDLWWSRADGAIARVTGASDAGGPIDGMVLQAATACGRATVRKHFTTVRPFFTGLGTVNFAMTAAVDYEEPELPGAQVSVGEAGPEWDVAAWDTASWGQRPRQTTGRKVVNRKGYKIAVAIATRSLEMDQRLLQTQVTYEPAAI